MNNVRQQTLLKIVELMRGELDKGMTILEISKKLKIGYRPAYLHIKAMEKERIINVQTVGNAKQCSLNIKNAKTMQLLEAVDLAKNERLFKENQTLKTIIENLVLKLTNEFMAQIHSIVLFGSHAKKTAEKDSDIDMLFIISDLNDKKTRNAIERESANYQYSHNIKISPLISDINEFRKMLKADQFNVGKEIRAHGISVYGHEMFWRILA